MYSGVIVLKNHVHVSLYGHLLKLHLEIRILTLPGVCCSLNALARGFLTEYVEEWLKLYGHTFPTQNAHSLIHLPDVAMRFGHLDRVSAFPFENKLGMMKNMFRKRGDLLAQNVNRTTEIPMTHYEPDTVDPDAPPFLDGKQFNGPMLPGVDDNQYKKLYYSGWKITVKKPDNCVILKKTDVVIVKNIVLKDNGEITLFGSIVWYMVTTKTDVVIVKNIVLKDNGEITLIGSIVWYIRKKKNCIQFPFQVI